MGNSPGKKWSANTRRRNSPRAAPPQNASEFDRFAASSHTSRRMLAEIEKLLVLQNRDRKIRTLRNELKMVPVERKNLEEKLSETQQSLETARLKGREIEVERKKLENEAQAKRDSIAKFQTQKFQTRKNEEFQALNNEITRFEGDIRTIEDRELELMESAETMKTTIAEADQQARSAKTLVEQQLADLTTKAQALEAQLDGLKTEREKLADGVEEDLLDTFNRIFTNKSEAVVLLEHDVCMGCHMKVTTQTAVRVRGGREIVHCEHCGRILYAER